MIFGSAMKKLDYENVSRSLQVMESHIRSLQEQLEYTLYNLDSANVTSIDTCVTDITSNNGGISISGGSISLVGSLGEKVIMGNQGDIFRLVLAGKGGIPALYLDSSGRIVVGEQSEIYLDCGVWD
ncbi:MAG: hypothetical protein VB078_07810 [Clostridiaceae bacterium]|nr:hypothetical protein [Clostridiaceae bacterium]